MIAAVSGPVLARRPDHVVIDAGGVGYKLMVSTETLKAVSSEGEDASLHAHLVARDDSLTLFGFAGEDERALFCQLISVSGVGPKVAIAVLSGSDEELVGEAADILFHLIVALNARDVPLADVLAELDRREGVSGIEEKASRSA